LKVHCAGCEEGYYSIDGKSGKEIKPKYSPVGVILGYSLGVCYLISCFWINIGCAKTDENVDEEEEIEGRIYNLIPF